VEENSEGRLKGLKDDQCFLKNVENEEVGLTKTDEDDGQCVKIKQLLFKVLGRFELPFPE